MRGIVRAVIRLALMALVMVAVLVTATALGLPTAAGLGLSITMAGLAGMVGLARRGPSSEVPPVATPTGGLASVISGATSFLAGLANESTGPDPAADRVVASMAPEAAVDPESLMPRWRRPSLLAARKSDPLRVARLERNPMRFGPASDPSPNRRVVRYAVVSLLDRPDEMVGRPISDLLSGDEVEVLDSGSAFWEILCPDGLRGWVHRTTLGLPGPDHMAFGRREAQAEPDDILTAVLSARGIH